MLELCATAQSFLFLRPAVASGRSAHAGCSANTRSYSAQPRARCSSGMPLRWLPPGARRRRSGAPRAWTTVRAAWSGSPAARRPQGTRWGASTARRAAVRPRPTGRTRPSSASRPTATSWSTAHTSRAAESWTGCAALRPGCWLRGCLTCTGLWEGVVDRRGMVTTGWALGDRRARGCNASSLRTCVDRMTGLPPQGKRPDWLSHHLRLWPSVRPLLADDAAVRGSGGRAVR